MAGPDEGGWQAAEALAVKHVVRSRGVASAEVLDRRTTLPYLVEVLLPGGTTVRTLVHGGSVVEGGGLAGLGAYLRSLAFVAGRAPTAEDLLLLLQQFDAYPPVAGVEGYPPPSAYHYNEFADAELNPRLDFDASGARFTLCYALEVRPIPPGIAIGARIPGSQGTRPMARWTLAIPGNDAPTWTEERFRHPSGGR